MLFLDEFDNGNWYSGRGVGGELALIVDSEFGGVIGIRVDVIIYGECGELFSSNAKWD